MRSPWPPVIILVIGIICLMAFLVTNIFRIGSSPQHHQIKMVKTIKCMNPHFDIAMMIEDSDKTFFVGGQQVEPENIEMFNDMAIRAKWLHKDGYTNIFLDRVNGKVELTEYDFQDIPIKKDELNCVNKRSEF
ncbi:MAG: hypothetical protein OEY94_01490 [Alphaproteobacteria bacterium]|nr:hypothetical protein [Alphaproteobacteria bacterium]